MQKRDRNLQAFGALVSHLFFCEECPRVAHVSEINGHRERTNEDGEDTWAHLKFSGASLYKEVSDPREATRARTACGWLCAAGFATWRVAREAWDNS